MLCDLTVFFYLDISNLINVDINLYKVTVYQIFKISTQVNL